MGKFNYKWPCSIAILNYRRVSNTIEHRGSEYDLKQPFSKKKLHVWIIIPFPHSPWKQYLCMLELVLKNSHYCYQHIHILHHHIYMLSMLSIVIIVIHITTLVCGFTPSETIWKSNGMMTFPIYGTSIKSPHIKQQFQLSQALSLDLLFPLVRVWPGIFSCAIDLNIGESHRKTIGKPWIS